MLRRVRGVSRDIKRISEFDCEKTRKIRREKSCYCGFRVRKERFKGSKPEGRMDLGMNSGGCGEFSLE